MTEFVFDRNNIAEAVEAYAAGIDWEGLTLPLCDGPETDKGYLAVLNGDLVVFAIRPSWLELPVVEVLKWSDTLHLATVMLSDGTVRDVTLCDLDALQMWVNPSRFEDDDSEMEVLS